MTKKKRRLYVLLACAVGLGSATALTLAAGFGWIGLWGFIGLVPLLTGLAGYCPIYTLFGRGT